MNLWLAGLVIAALDAVAISIMLLVRRRAPSGSYFKDTQQAAGVLAVVGTTFAVIVAFVFLLAFQSYDDARRSAEQEANAVNSLFHTAELFPPATRDSLQGELVCYGRAVAHAEWATMRGDHRSPLVNLWVRRLERTVHRAPVTGSRQEAGLDQWLDESDQRQDARRGRLSQAAPFVPPLVWMTLVVGGLLVILYVGFFADSRERRLSQAMMIGSATTIITASLLVVRFLDSPYQNQTGSIRPAAMEQTVSALRAEQAPGSRAVVPCDGRGVPAPPEPRGR